MEDSLEKITINIDSYNATFIDDYEFYVDIIDDIKNCIYIKTLKTEVFTNDVHNTEKSVICTFDEENNINKFRTGEYIYISLNDIHRINTISKEVVPKRFKDLNIEESGFGLKTGFSITDNGNSSNYINYTKVSNEIYHGDDSNPYSEVSIKDIIVYETIDGWDKDIIGNYTNYKIKDIYYNTLRYFENIYIDNNEGGDTGLKIYKQELTGTSCGPNDTNTKVLNPILPELRRFNIILWRVDEWGKHVKVPIGTNEHVFRVIMSFTIYYKRKKITRV